MLELAFVQLLVSGLTVAREVLALCKVPARRFQQRVTRRCLSELPREPGTADGNIRCGQETVQDASVGRALDREFMMHVIFETSQRLEALIEIQSAFDN